LHIKNIARNEFEGNDLVRLRTKHVF